MYIHTYTYTFTHICVYMRMYMDITCILDLGDTECNA